MRIDEKLARVYNLYEGIANDDDTHTRLFLTSTTEYRGLSYDIWFGIFVQYAILLSRFDNNTEYATHIIEVAKDVNVFVQDKNKETILNMVHLIFGIKQEEIGTVIMTYIRYFCLRINFLHLSTSFSCAVLHPESKRGKHLLIITIKNSFCGN